MFLWISKSPAVKCTFLFPSCSLVLFIMGPGENVHSHQIEIMSEKRDLAVLSGIETLKKKKKVLSKGCSRRWQVLWSNDSPGPLLNIWSKSFRDWWFFFFCTHGIWKFLGQGSNLRHSCNLCYSCSNAGSLTHCTRQRIKPAPHQWPETFQRQCWILNLLDHSENSRDWWYLCERII